MNKKWIIYYYLKSGNKKSKKQHKIVDANTEDEAIKKANIDNSLFAFDNIQELKECNSKKLGDAICGKILFIGTHATTQSLEAGFYYFAVESGNKFWELMDCACGIKNNSNKESFSYCARTRDIKHIKELLSEYKIGLGDMIGCCWCASSNDNSIVLEKPNDNKYQNLQKAIDEAEYIVFNGMTKVNKSPYGLWKKYIQDGTFVENKKAKKIFIISSSNNSLGGRKKTTADERRKDWTDKLSAIIKDVNNR